MLMTTTTVSAGSNRTARKMMNCVSEAERAKLDAIRNPLSAKNIGKMSRARSARKGGIDAALP
jgi:hypothetical protein